MRGGESRGLWTDRAGGASCSQRTPNAPLFARHWFDDDCEPSDDHCEATDLDLSGAVDIRDLKVFADNLLAGVAP